MRNACLLPLCIALIFLLMANGREGLCHAQAADPGDGTGVSIAPRVKPDLPEAPPSSLPPNPARPAAPAPQPAPAVNTVFSAPADVPASSMPATDAPTPAKQSVISPGVISPVGVAPAADAPSPAMGPIIRPLEPVSASPSGEITIQPDCLIQVKVEEDPALDGSYPVNELGAIELGYVGPVILFNMTEPMAVQKIRTVLEARFFQRATVGVKIVRASYDKILVGGGVNKPGAIKIGAGDRMSLNDALLRAGGLKPSPSGAKVKVIRNGLLSPMPLSLPGEEYSLISSNGLPTVPAVLLKNNDVAYIFSSTSEAVTEGGEKEVLVLGEVGKPGTYRFSAAEPCTMMHLVLDKLGGLPAYANKRDVKIIRRDRDGFEEEIEVNLEEILETGDPDKDVPLEHGDRVVIPPRYLLMF